MRWLLLLLSCTLLFACEYTVPLVETPTVAIDRSAIGLWKNTRAKKEENRLLVLPLNDTEYLITYPATQDHAMYARATLWSDKDISLVQLDWFGTAQGITPKDNRTFQYARYAIDGDTLRIELLNTKLVPKALTSTAALAKAIRANRNKPGLFREEMVFKRMVADE